MDESEVLFARYDALTRESPLEDWRQLSHDLLDELVTRQGRVIQLQRRAFECVLRGERTASLFRTTASAAFAEVQRLNLLRRKVQAMLAQKRALATHQFVVQGLDVAA